MQLVEMLLLLLLVPFNFSLIIICNTVVAKGNTFHQFLVLVVSPSRFGCMSFLKSGVIDRVRLT